MKNYKSKDHNIRAVQYLGIANMPEILDVIFDNYDYGKFGTYKSILVHLPKETLVYEKAELNIGDYLVCDNGTLSVLTEDTFKKYYEKE